MPRPQIPVEKVTQLPLMHRATVPEDYKDAMGHMNVRWYLALFDDAGWTFSEQFGMTYAHYEATQTGEFALQHIIHYLAEVHIGETVAIYSRMLARAPKLIHFAHFMVNESTGKLAATMEGLGAHADLTTRRTTPYPPAIAEKIDALIAEHNALDWDFPLSGAIQIKPASA
jgi:acyl-CoA thioester hydrolase